MVEISAAEREAERIYYAAISRKYTFKEAVLAAKALERESEEGAAYLRWLLARGDAWLTPDSVFALLTGAGVTIGGVSLEGWAGGSSS